MSKTLHDYLETYIPEHELKEVKRLVYGRSDDFVVDLPEKATKIAADNDFEIKAFSFPAKKEELRKPRIVRIGAIQHSMVLPTTDPIEQQRSAIHDKVSKMIKAAAEAGVNIVCTSEAWTMPFALCTHEKDPWIDFAEDAKTGPTTKMLSDLAKTYNIVIVSSILVKDPEQKDTIWNAGVVISNKGQYLGHHHKNHIPAMEDCNETVYYKEGNTGHPVFETEFGKIAINICFGRHHPQNWMMFGLNGAEIVFNPVATEGNSDIMWDIEARNAAIANSYFTVPINRVGVEKFMTGEEKNISKEFGPYYGSSYVAAPDGSRSPGLSRDRDGLLIAELDLNLCTQVKDFWGFRMTQRLPLYAESLARASKPDFKPQLIS